MTSRISIVVSLVLGIGMGCVAMYTGWQHNSQGEFRGEGGVDWTYLLVTGLSWAVPVTFLAMVVMESLRFLVDAVQDRRPRD